MSTIPNKPVIYTIGHSTHAADYFLSLLQAHAVNCVVDVRSVAASKYNPQFGKATLNAFLKQHAITYLHFAQEFGARRSDPVLLKENGRVDFEKVRQSAIFKKGVERLKQGAGKGYTIALMCAESDPLQCHRFGMITPALAEEGFEVMHILKDHSVISNTELEEVLLKKYKAKRGTKDLFKTGSSKAAQLNAAYDLFNQDIGFKAPPEENKAR